MSAEVTRTGADHRVQHLPLFQVPVLRYEDRLDISLSGEAFDPRVTQADWALIVVFLPRTVVPTERGVVELPLRKLGENMVAAPFKAPYDSIPLFFLVPDKGGRRKILTDLSAHLGAFRSICLKLSDLTEKRANADRFLAGLDSIEKNQSPASYDTALLNFMQAYGASVSQDFQIFLARDNTSNLEKFQYLTQAFSQTNSQTAANGGSAPMSLQGESVSGPLRASSAYVAIAFDLVQIFQNLWPGHQFQYVPTLARDFDGKHAQLWYGDWIHTTGDVRGALVFSPCRWEDADPPSFTFDLPAGGSLLQPFERLQIHPKAKSNLPFALYGHDWHLVIGGAKGPSLTIPLMASPDRQTFVITQGPAQETLRKLNLRSVRAKIEGAWGFEPVATQELTLPSGIDPAWHPMANEKSLFMIGETCTFHLPSPWAACVGHVSFRPADPGQPSLEAKLNLLPEGARAAEFTKIEGVPGAGTLDIYLTGSKEPSLRVPLPLQPPLPVVDHVEVHQGENSVLVVGSHLQTAKACRLGNLLFVPGQSTGEGRVFVNQKAALAEEGGSLLQGGLLLLDGRELPLKAVPMQPPRPQVGSIQIIPEHPLKGLPLTSDRPLVPPASEVLISVLPGRKGEFPFGRRPKLFLRSGEDLTSVQPVPPKNVRVVGRGQRILATLQMSQLFGSSGGGHLELQVADVKAGASAWVPLQPLFLELPEVSQVRLNKLASRLEGPSLETIESVASSPAGPWVAFSFSFQGDLETGEGPLPSSDGSLFLRLYGWPNQLIRLQAQLPAPPAPLLAPAAGTTRVPPGNPDQSKAN